MSPEPIKATGDGVFGSPAHSQLQHLASFSQNTFSNCTDITKGRPVTFCAKRLEIKLSFLAPFVDDEKFPSFFLRAEPWRSARMSALLSCFLKVSLSYRTKCIVRKTKKFTPYKPLGNTYCSMSQLSHATAELSCTSCRWLIYGSVTLGFSSFL